MPAIISAAEVTDAEAIHPGYGFLSENAGFTLTLPGIAGLIVGVANTRSIAWAIAQAASAAGARLAVTYQGERLEENVRELCAGLKDPLILPLDVTSDANGRGVATTTVPWAFAPGSAGSGPAGWSARSRW